MGDYARGELLLPDARVVQWLFTDRTNGRSSAPYDEANLGAHVGDDPEAVQANRAALAASLAVSPAALFTMNQVHGGDVVVIDGQAVGDAQHGRWTPPDADALITEVADVALVTQVADCVPILLAGPRGTVAAVHSGWRGVVAGIVDATIEQFQQRGVAPSTLQAWIGPAICPDCYEVGADVRDAVSACAPAAFATTRMGTPAVDVQAGVREQLARHGIDAHVVSGCTAHDEGLFSYRRDGVTGRQAGVIICRAPRS